MKIERLKKYYPHTTWDEEADIVVAAHWQALLDVAEAAGALKGDLDAHDESPHHFSSYLVLSEALKKLEEIE